MGGVFLFSTLHGGTEQPLPPAVSMSPSVSADAYLCSSTCADRPLEHDPTVEMAHHFGPPIVIGPTPAMPAIVIGPLPVPKQAKPAAQGSTRSQKQASRGKGAKASKGSKGKAQKAPKAPKQPKTTPAPVVVPTAPTLPATVPQS